MVFTFSFAEQRPQYNVADNKHENSHLPLRHIIGILISIAIVISELPELDFDLELTTTINPMTLSLPVTTTVSSTTTSVLTKSIQFKSMDLESNKTLTPNDLEPNPDLSTRRSQTLPDSGYTVIPGQYFTH